MQFLKGHGYEQTIYALAFSPDGKELASCGLDGWVRLWDLTSGKQKSELGAHYSTRSVCYTSDGRFFAWPRYGELGVQDRLISGFAHHSFPEVGSVPLAVFGPDPRFLFCTYRSWQPRRNAFLLFDRTSGKWEEWPDSDHCNETALALSRDGQTMATGHQIPRPGTTPHSARRYEHVVRVWDVAERKLRATLTGHTAQISTLAFSPSARHLAVTSGTVLWVWDITTQEMSAQVKYDKQHFKSVAFSPDGRWLATARNDATVRFFDTQSWNEGPSFDWKIGPVVVITFARDGMRAAAGSSKGKIVVWDVDE